MKKTNWSKFIKSTYQGNIEDYEYILQNPDAMHWDYVFITASNERQAKVFEQQISLRQQANRLPKQTEFVVLPDAGGQRIGSGGATLGIMKWLYDRYGLDEMLHHRILVLHSGGDSKRLAQYSVLGKLFSPVPRYVSDDIQVTIFDELIMMCAALPARVDHGMLLLAGDTVMVFNPMQVDLHGKDAVGISMKAPAYEGEGHGVFVCDEKNVVNKFLHKQPVSILRREGAVDANDRIDIDTGFLWFSEEVCKSLFKLCLESISFSSERYDKCINERVRLSLYADFESPLASFATWDSYKKEVPENSFSEELESIRKEIWQNTRGFVMSIQRLMPGGYYHFGTTEEMHRLMTTDMPKYEHLGWVKNQCASIEVDDNACYVACVDESVTLGKNNWIEYSRLDKGTVLSEGSVLSNVSLQDVCIPLNVVLSGTPVDENSWVCRIYGVNDNPKGSAGSAYLENSISAAMKFYDISDNALWDDDVASIWNAKLFPIEGNMQQAVNSALELYDIINCKASTEVVKNWLNKDRTSLKDSFNAANVDRLIAYQTSIRSMVKRAKISKMLSEAVPLSEIAAGLSNASDNLRLLKSIVKDKTLAWSSKMRGYILLSMFEKNKGKAWEDKCYDYISNLIVDDHLKQYAYSNMLKNGNVDLSSAKARAEIELPVRVNFCGSPSDAAPYCLEHGGTMLDGAVLLNGKYPIICVCERINSAGVKLISKDLGRSAIVTSDDELGKCDNTDDVFILHKAVLKAMGLSIKEVDGFSIETFADVPKGSGLGTSSIVAAAITLAVAKVLGIMTSDQYVYSTVFSAEQLMTTGGGWQDQVGGLYEGLKYFTAKPGIRQIIEVENLKLDEAVLSELNERFALIFSGQRRLAKNVLRTEMNRCIARDPKVMNAVEELQLTCSEMRYYLMKGDITAFGECVKKQYKLTQIVDSGCTNLCIDYIFEVIADLVDGYSICGAGGGGFLQVILKKGITKAMLKERLDKEFAGSGVEMYDTTLV